MVTNKAAAHLDLDELEREDDPGPFTFTLGGRDYLMIDPQDLDWRELTEVIEVANSERGAVGGLTDALNKILGDEGDVEAFWKNRMPAFKLDRLLTDYMAHYKLPTPGEAGASSRSSSGTGRPSKRTSPSARRR